MLINSVFERKGGPPHLTDVFSRFCEVALRGISIDTLLAKLPDRKTAPDYVCLSGLLLFEFKELETDRDDRINSVLSEGVAPSDVPQFLGGVPIEHYLKRVSNAEDLRRSINSKLRRTISAHLKKASSQISNYRSMNPRFNKVDVCVLFNSRIDVFDPPLMTKIVHGLMRTENYMKSMDAVIFISEKHFSILDDGRPSFSTVVMENDLGSFQEWKADLLALVVKRWSFYRTGSAPEVREFSDLTFDSVADTQDRMPRSAHWKHEYKIDPYFREFDEHALIVILMMNTIEIMLAVLKGNWVKPPPERTAEQFRMFSALTDKFGHRGLTVEQFSHRNISVEERKRFIRPGIPEEIIEFILQP